MFDDEFPEIDDKAIAVLKAAGVEAAKEAMESGGGILSVKEALKAALKGVGSDFTDALLDTSFAAGSKFDAMQAALEQGGIEGVAALGEELMPVLEPLACLKGWQTECPSLLELGVRNADSVLAFARTAMRLLLSVGDEPGKGLTCCTHSAALSQCTQQHSARREGRHCVCVWHRA